MLKRRRVNISPAGFFCTIQLKLGPHCSEPESPPTSRRIKQKIKPFLDKRSKSTIIIGVIKGLRNQAAPNRTNFRLVAPHTDGQSPPCLSHRDQAFFWLPKRSSPESAHRRPQVVIIIWTPTVWHDGRHWPNAGPQQRHDRFQPANKAAPRTHTV
jgi:hypothetical protein